MPTLRYPAPRHTSGDRNPSRLWQHPLHSPVVYGLCAFRHSWNGGRPTQGAGPGPHRGSAERSPSSKRPVRRLARATCRASTVGEAPSAPRTSNLRATDHCHAQGRDVGRRPADRRRRANAGPRDEPEGRKAGDSAHRARCRGRISDTVHPPRRAHSPQLPGPRAGRGPRPGRHGKVQQPRRTAGERAGGATRADLAQREDRLPCPSEGRGVGPRDVPRHRAQHDRRHPPHGRYHRQGEALLPEQRAVDARRSASGRGGHGVCLGRGVVRASGRALLATSLRRLATGAREMGLCAGRGDQGRRARPGGGAPQGDAGGADLRWRPRLRAPPHRGSHLGLRKHPDAPPTRSCIGPQGGSRRRLHAGPRGASARALADGLAGGARRGAGRLPLSYRALGTGRDRRRRREPGTARSGERRSRPEWRRAA